MTLSFDERDRRSVLGDLQSEDPEVRRLAVERVSMLPLEEAVRCLVEQLGDPNWRVRKAAVQRLVESSDGSAAVDGLVAALADGENAGRRSAAVETLIRCGPRVVPRLTQAASDADADVRKFAVDALAGIGDARALPVLIERCGDADPNVRAAAADALGAIGGSEAETALTEAAVRAGEDQLVRYSALRALETLDCQLPLDALAANLEDPVLRPAALVVLGCDERSESLDVLHKALGSSSRSTREAAMRALLRQLANADPADSEAMAAGTRESALRSDSLLDDALVRLEHAELATRLVLVQFLGLLQEDAVVVPLLCAARDEALAEVVLGALAALGEQAERVIDVEWERLVTEARRDACLLFGRTGGPRGTARLLASLADPEPELRVAAAHAVGERRLEDAAPLLVERLVEAASQQAFEGEEEGMALADALVRLAGPDAAPEQTRRVVEELDRRMDGAAAPVRLAVGGVLGRIGRSEDAALIARLLRDADAPVRRAAVEALTRLEPDTAEEPLRLALADESPLVRRAAAAALGASASDAVQDDLRHLADDPDPLVRATAVRAIGRRFTEHVDAARRDAARMLMRRSLEDEVPVALAALETLREVALREPDWVVPVLDRREPEVLQEAARCLGAIGDRSHWDALRSLVSHSDWSVRAEAISVLAEQRHVAAAPDVLRRLDTEQDEYVRGVILAAMRKLEG